MHPLALTVAFRQMARQMFSDSNNEPDDALQSVVDYNVFVDINILAKIWPRELDDYQILIINLNYAGT
jgi:hypothetical protein